ncbi:uncharacterized protein LY89DRAFT_579345 [Mollisia scopiformis]|uniref:Rhodopsin domain-containing protein n=1 Tax=Mollisia scopiformis TaxID=149040 RepID=A0A194XLD5_MOLSC|nr:uncharacterized protein LY89DRAFT_579345 [Mollisia scopiformis]KUJ20587.1 hypothetical protein LY89DRAFT_579345 [Mollisia scopiformis]
MILCVGARLFSKYNVIRRITLDDVLIGVTMVFAIAHTYALSMMVVNGLGRPQESLNDDMIEDFEQYGYVSQLLYIPALCLAKLSTLVYLRALSPDTPYVYSNIAVEIFVVLWAISAELAIAFQCSLPTAWAIITTKCFNVVPFWNTTGTFDILTDLAIIALPIYLLWAVQMPRSKKLLVFLVFGTRIFITPLTIMRIYFFNTISSPSLPDQTLTSYHAYLATTIQLNFAIFVACFPFLKPFMESMSSGGFASTLKPMDSSYGAGSKFSTFISGNSSRKASKPKGSYMMDSVTDSRASRSHNFSDMHVNALELPDTPRDDVDKSPSFHFGLTGGSPGDLGTLRPDKVTSFSHIGRVTPERSSARSSIGSDKMIIKRTTGWQVQESYEYDRGAEYGEGISKVDDEITPVPT